MQVTVCKLLWVLENASDCVQVTVGIRECK